MGNRHAALALAFTLIVPTVLSAQTTPKHPHVTPKPAAHKGDLEDFQIVNWLSLTPQDSLIRSSAGNARMDLTAREDDSTYVTVFGRKRRPDVGPRAYTGYTSAGNDAAIPDTLPIMPPTTCHNLAYNTIGGQAATGSDMVGFLSGGGGGC
ncbi:MAG TPA: hypothetical protein VMB71_09545 [Acetobacteraceae bacterium]|nr:hypothetical protein [Acetobacteraceae bacterium]